MKRLALYSIIALIGLVAAAQAQIVSSLSSNVASHVSPSAGVSAPPSPLGNWDAVGTACTGNLQGTVLSTCFSITGATTLGAPTTGYLYTQEAYPFAGFLYNSSGHNESLSSNTGRTAAVYDYAKIYQHGQGDLAGHSVQGFGDSTLASSTSFLANPAIIAYNGDLAAGVDGLYLNWGEATLNGSNGGTDYDVAGVGWDVNLARKNATGAKNANWIGYTVQSTGTKPADAAFRATGPFRTGINLIGMTIPDKTMQGTPTVSAGGTGYAVGDLLTAAGGTCDQSPAWKVLTLGASNAVATVALERAGLCSSAPVSPNTVTGGTGSGAQISFTMTSLAPAINLAPNQYISFNGSNDTGAYSTGYPSTNSIGGMFFGYNSSISALQAVVSGTSALQITSTTVTPVVDLNISRHTRSAGSSPALTSCGTNPAIVGGDSAGTVTMGTGSPTGCTITFAVAYAAAPVCTVSWRANIASMQYTTSTTALTLTQTGTSSNKVDYHCSAQNSSG